VVGVNHVSQVLSALDLLAEEEIGVEEFEAIFFTFVDQLEKLEQKWQFREVLLADRLAPTLKEKFGVQFQQLDQSLQMAFQGVEWVESILAGESDDFEAAEECLVGFFRGICGASALVLDNLDEFDKNKGSGMLFNLPSV
jgi:hypothetical protein